MEDVKISRLRVTAKAGGSTLSQMKSERPLVIKVREERHIVVKS